MILNNMTKIDDFIGGMLKPLVGGPLLFVLHKEMKAQLSFGSLEKFRSFLLGLNNMNKEDKLIRAIGPCGPLLSIG